MIDCFASSFHSPLSDSDYFIIIVVASLSKMKSFLTFRLENIYGTERNSIVKDSKGTVRHIKFTNYKVLLPEQPVKDIPSRGISLKINKQMDAN